MVEFMEQRPSYPRTEKPYDGANCNVVLRREMTVLVFFPVG